MTYLASAVLISRIRYHHKPELDSPDKSIVKALKQYVDGLRYLWQHSDFLVIASQKAAFALTLGGAFQVVQVALAKEAFAIGQGGGTSLGIMFAAMGIGTGLGPIIGRRFTGDRDRSLRIALAISYFMGAIGMAMMAPLSSFAVVLIGMVIRGIGGGIIWVFSTQLLLQLVPDRVRGRVFATEFALFTLMMAFGAAAGGWALDNTELGISDMLWLMALLTLVPGVLWVLWNLRKRRLEPSRTEDEVAEAVVSTTEPPAGI
jgi:MFS family permease